MNILTLICFLCSLNFNPVTIQTKVNSIKHFTGAYSLSSDNSFHSFMKGLRKAIKSNDTAALKNMISYPYSYSTVFPVGQFVLDHKINFAMMKATNKDTIRNTPMQLFQVVDSINKHFSNFTRPKKAIKELLNQPIETAGDGFLYSIINVYFPDLYDPYTIAYTSVGFYIEKNKSGNYKITHIFDYKAEE